MRPNAVLFALLTLVTLPACQRIEDKVEAKAEDEVTAKTVSAMGGTFSSGGCPSLPPAVPLYGSKSEISCTALDFDAVQDSSTLKALGVADGKRPTEGNLEHLKLYLVVSRSNADPGAVRGFYEGAFPDYVKGTTDSLAIPTMPRGTMETLTTNDKKLSNAVFELGLVFPTDGKRGFTLLVYSATVKKS